MKRTHLRPSIQKTILLVDEKILPVRVSIPAYKIFHFLTFYFLVLQYL